MLSYVWTRRLIRAALATAAVLLFIAVLTSHKYGNNHILRVDSLAPSAPHGSLDESYLPQEPAPSLKRSMCRANGCSAYTTTGPARKVYDLILLSTELDWLEIRLHTLTPWVDYYIMEQNKAEGRFKHLLNWDGEDAGFEDWEIAMWEGAE